ncbi:MAG: PEP-CTERM sorting domain-containing protein [Pseudomonadota bacterium]
MQILTKKLSHGVLSLKKSSKLLAKISTSIVFATAMTSVGQAAVTDVRLYHLGESDPGAMPGVPGFSFTTDSGSNLPTIDALKVGIDTYVGSSASGAAGSLVFPEGSTLAMAFKNVDSVYHATGVFGINDNFGMEAFVLPDVNIQEARFFYNGGSGTPYANNLSGCGLVIHGGEYVAEIGQGLAPSVYIPSNIFTSTATNRMVEMAIVREQGVFTFYVNKAVVGTSSAIYHPLSQSSEQMSIGNFIYTPLSGDSGIVDEARLFTFTPGNFYPSGPSGPSGPGGDLKALSVPEPSALFLIGSALGLAGLRRFPRVRVTR